MYGTIYCTCNLYCIYGTEMYILYGTEMYVHGTGMYIWYIQCILYTLQITIPLGHLAHVLLMNVVV